MRNYQFLNIMLVIAVIILISGCKKENEKDLNNIIIAGNNNADLNLTLTPESCCFFTTGECSGTLDRIIVQLFFTSDAAIEINLYVPSGSESVLPGTYSLQTSCLSGFNASFYLSYFKKSSDLYFSDGTITVTLKGDTYDIDFNLINDPGCGGGTLKGNYHGAITESIGK